MSFELFTETRIRRQPGYDVSLGAKGDMHFPRSTVEKYNMGRYVYALLYFDRSTKRVGIKLTSETDNPGARKISRAASTMKISAKGFCNRFEIGPEHAGPYNMEYDREQQMLIFQVKVAAPEFEM
tara:strand:+ start:33 stop:407 length:375 start_codon:yes stop_codon:yes gene_type:complete